MEFTQIKEEVCPICGSHVVQENREDQHSNSYWNERRKFACGLELKFSPNLMKTERSKYYVCEKDPLVIARKEKIKKVSKVLIDKIKKLDCDELFKTEIIENVQAIVRRYYR